MACLSVLRVTNLPHEVHPVSNHYENDTHILGKTQKKVAEVLAFYLRVLLVQFLNSDQSVYNLADSFAEVSLDIIYRNAGRQYRHIEQNGDNAVAPQSDIVDGNLRCLQSLDERD